MRKRLLVIFGIFGLLLAGCHTVPNAAQETNTITPTGYASEEVPRISLFYDGSLYLYNATGFDLQQKGSWEFLGQIAFVNNLEYPTKDLNGTHLNVGQEVYRDPEFPQKLIRVLHSLKQKRLQRKKLRSILIMYMRELGWQLLTAFS